MPRPRRRVLGARRGSRARSPTPALVVAAGIPARPEPRAGAAHAWRPASRRSWSPRARASRRSTGRLRRRSRATSLADLRIESDALRRRDLDRAADAAQRRVARRRSGRRSGRRRGDDCRQLRRRAHGADAAAGRVPGPAERRRATSRERTSRRPTVGREASLVSRRDPVRFRRTVELQLDGDAYRIVRSEGGLPLGSQQAPSRRAARSAERRSSTSRRKSGSTSARARSGSGCRPTRRR